MSDTRHACCECGHMASERDEAYRQRDECLETLRQAAAVQVETLEQRDDVRAACKGLMQLIDDAVLVRNIENDGDPSWVMAGLRLVKTLKESQAAIAKATPQPAAVRRD